jgi:hypothetical protein
VTSDHSDSEAGRGSASAADDTAGRNELLPGERKALPFRQSVPALSTSTTVGTHSLRSQRNILIGVERPSGDDDCGWTPDRYSEPISVTKTRKTQNDTHDCKIRKLDSAAPVTIQQTGDAKHKPHEDKRHESNLSGRHHSKPHQAVTATSFDGASSTSNSLFIRNRIGTSQGDRLGATMQIDKRPAKCSAVSTMERSMPDFDYSHLTRELRALVIEDIKREPNKYHPDDVQRVYNDSWFVERYLLRNKLDVRSAHQMISKALEFRNSPVNQITEFPHEFYKIGAIFVYEPDRKGNIPVWMRICVNQKIPLVQQFTKSFLFRVIEEADRRAGGKGIALCFDLQNAGIQNVDMDLLFFVITTLVNYFPKGLSYMLVHELPWVLRSFWVVAKQWLADDHKDLVKFSDSRTIYEYFEEQNLPDFVGGTCKRDYRTVPDNSITLTQAAKRWNLNEEECFKIRRKFAEHLPDEPAH